MAVRYTITAEYAPGNEGLAGYETRGKSATFRRFRCHGGAVELHVDGDPVGVTWFFPVSAVTDLKQRRS